MYMNDVYFMWNETELIAYIVGFDVHLNWNVYGVKVWNNFIVLWLELDLNWNVYGVKYMYRLHGVAWNVFECITSYKDTPYNLECLWMYKL